MSVDSPAIIVYNIDGYAVGITLDGYDYRFQVESSIKPGTSILTSGGNIPSNPELIIASKLLNNGSSNFLVDGYTVSKTFKYLADPIKDIKLSELRLVLVSCSLDFIGTHFGSITTLTNGVQIIVKSSGVLTTLATLKINEDFLLFHSTNSIFLDKSGPKDTIAAGYLLGGAIILKGGTDDYLGVIIRDNLTSSSFAYFQAVGYGVREL
jgi:hypothetical protein